LVQQLLEEKTTLLVADAQNDPRFIVARDWIREYNLVSMLVLPFIQNAEVIGFFVLEATEKREFLPEEIELAQSVADQVSGALARSRLDEEYRQLNAAIEQTVDSVIITNIAGEIAYVNPGFERVSGYSRTEVLGQHVKILNSGEHDSAFFREMWQTILLGNIWHGHVINKKKDGTHYTDEVIITPVRNGAGEIVNFVSVQRDVTRELELQEQLRRSQRMEAVGQLTAGIAHDFNNLLTAINGFAELLQRQLPPDSLQYEMAAKILQSGEHAADLINQLLAFSRKQVISPKVLNINHIIINVDKILQRLISEEIELRVNMSPGLWLCQVDPTQIEQVIINLAVNARDAMPGGGELVIETGNVTLDDAYTTAHIGVNTGDYVLLAVSDTGHGMSKEIQARIFEPFFTTKEVHEGTGLGLASVFGIVKQSGGNIWVYSEQGVGTTFKVYLPRVVEDPYAPVQATQSGELPRGTETILLVEDETMVRDYAARVLTGQGYTVLQAGNGREALQISQQYWGDIHLLLTDVVMPEIGGKLLSEQIKLGYPNIKILFTSGYTDNTIIRQGIPIDGSDFIQKPFSPAELATSVREILGS
jgi:PAS domain S-box-containing protein